MRAEIISVGDEVLRGDVVNTNTSFLSARLSELGFTVHHQSSVGDHERDLIEAIKTAVSRSHVTVFTGGLGPTDDDMTKETVAKAIGRKLVLDEETANTIKGWFAARGATMTDNNMKQAMVIEGCDVLKNNNGTAPGIYIQQGNQALILLPGPPRELEPLFDEEVRPRLEAFTDSKNCYISLNVFGVGESALEEAIKDLLYSDNPTAACYAKTGEVQVRVTGRGKTEEEAKQLAGELAAKIKDRVGSFVYSDKGESLAETVVGKLKQQGKHIALAESCTGGLMAADITAVPGSSEVFEYGISSYADWVKKRNLDVDRLIIKKYSAVSSETAAEMAKGALYEGRADYGVGITGIAGPDAGEYGEKEVGLVYIAVADKDSVTVKVFHFGGHRGRDYIRNMAVKNAFDMVRRILDNLSIEDARSFGHKEIADLTRDNPRTLTALAAKRVVLGVVATLLVAAAIYFGFSLDPAPRSSPQLATASRIKIDFNAKAEENKRVTGLYELAALNEDTVGWVQLPDTDYGNVVVQGENNEFYRAHDFEGNESESGTPFADAEMDILRGVSNLVVYGSGAGEDQLGFLENFKNLSFLQQNQIVSFESLFFDEREYKIVSVYYANADENHGDVQPLNIFDFEDYDAFKDYVVDLKMRSVFTTPYDIVSGDSFLTLVSDTAEWDGAKIVVVARQLRDGEERTVEATEIVRNESVLYPDQWYAVNGASSSVDTEEQREKWETWLRENDVNAPEEEETAAQVAAIDKELVELVGKEEPQHVDTNEGTGMAGPGASTGGNAGNSENAGGNTPSTGGQISVTSTATGKVYTGTPLEIVSMIVEAEVGASFHPEAIKAQAVATITYLKYSYRTSSAPAVPLKTASQTVKDNVAQVIDVAMLYNGSYIYAPYCASMADRSNACHEVWVQNLPYLVSVESKYDNTTSGFSKTYTWSKAEMKKILEDYYEITLSDTPENWIQVLDQTSGGYVGNMSIDGKYNTTGSRFRANCVYIRSAAFTHSYDAATETFTITTRGYGHGVGMSQHGANLYARNEGWGYQQILSHYYTGVSFGSAGW